DQLALMRLVELLAQDLLRGANRQGDHLLLDDLLGLLTFAADLVLRALQPGGGFGVGLLPDLTRHLLPFGDRLGERLPLEGVDAAQLLFELRLRRVRVLLTALGLGELPRDLRAAIL